MNKLDSNNSQNALMTAYAATEFTAHTAVATVVLKVGVENSKLLECYRAFDRQSAAFITGWNPGSRIQASEWNDQAHAKLIARINAGGYRFFEGEGRDPNGVWAPERSLLIFGIERYIAEEIGREFGQAAIVVVGQDGVPILVWLGN
jgi:hypothetical protein